MRASSIAFLKVFLLALAWAFAQPVQAQVQARQADMMDRGTAQLLVEGPARPGGEAQLALLFRPLAGWHGYWSNPGDAGLGMELEWSLPEGWTAGAPYYPVPQRLVISGLMNHVYEGEHAVLVPLAIPATARAGQSYPIELFAQWLTCSDKLCVPQWATLRATVVIGTPGATDTRFDSWRAALPPPLDRKGAFDLAAAKLRLAIPIPSTMKLEDPHVFVGQTQLVDYVAPQAFSRDGDTLIVEIPRAGIGGAPAAVSGILKLDNAGNGVAFSSVPGRVPSGGEPIAGSAGPAVAPLWLLVGGALLGGLLLNIMPCVFPILSLKAMTLARAGESEAGARREGMAYTAGVVLTCLLLGGVMLALRVAGNEIGWAFQLQEPGVVVVLLALAVVITANFAGLFEMASIGFISSGGRSSAFATGLLAAFVATPCTGPFMVAAMGAALLLPWWQGMVLFAALGLGLALPFLLLGWVPALRRMLPRPGGWMNTFRRIMAIPMGLTALALLWLCSRLGGINFALSALALSAILLLVLWLAGREQRRGRGAMKTVAVGAAVFAAFALGAMPAVYAPPQASSGESILDPLAFDEAKLQQLVSAEGKPVFLWFTADWCVTCKVNEGVAIEREATKEAFEKAGVVAMRGDWTRQDPAITRFLNAQGAAGVPLYLWYEPNRAPRQLPQVLTPDMLADLANTNGKAAR